MKRHISVQEIVSHTEYIYDLLRSQNYVPLGVILTPEERTKLFNFLYVYSEFDYKIRFNDHYPLADNKAALMSEEAFYDMDNDIKFIITKIGVNPYSIFVSNGDKIELDDRITKSLYAQGMVRVGEYTVTRTLSQPITYDSPLLKYMDEEKRLKYTEEFREGVPKFELRDKNNNLVYYHGNYGNSVDSKNMIDIRYNGIQLNGNYLTYFQGSLIPLALDMGDILIFFDNIEKLLNNQLTKKIPIELYRKKVLTEEDHN